MPTGKPWFFEILKSEYARDCNGRPILACFPSDHAQTDEIQYTTERLLRLNIQPDGS